MKLVASTVTVKWTADETERRLLMETCRSVGPGVSRSWH